MTLQITLFSKRDDWLAARGRYLGASEIAALLCTHPYLTPFKLSAKKLRLAPDEEETKEMRRGRLLEDDALQCVREDNPAWDVRSNALPQLRHWSRGRLGATPDAFITLPEREGDGILQVKSVNSFAFKRHWIDEDGLVVPPLWVAVQATVEAVLTGSRFAFVAALRVDPFIVETIEVPLVEGIYDRAQEAAAAFWAKIDAGEMYEPDFTRDAALIDKLYGSDESERTVDLSADNEIHRLAAAYADAAAIAKEAKKTHDQVKAAMLFKMGGAATAMVNSEVFATVRTVNKRSFIVKATSYPLLAFKGGETNWAENR